MPVLPQCFKTFRFIPIIDPRLILPHTCSLLLLRIHAAASVLPRRDMRDHAEAAVEICDIIEAAAPRDLRYAHVASAEIIHRKLYPLAGDICPDGYAVEIFEKVRELTAAHSVMARYFV